MEGLHFSRVLIDGMYGWRRYPASEDATDIYAKWWNVGTGLMSYGVQHSQDVYASFRQSSAAYSLSRDLGANSQLMSWQLSGVVGFDLDTPNTAGNDMFIDVLDGAGKIITRFYTAGDATSDPLVRIYGNTSLIAKELLSVVQRPVLYTPQPISISVDNGRVTFKYGPYAPVITSVFNPASSWHSPRKLQVSFIGSASGSRVSRVIDLQKMRFLPNSAAPPPPAPSMPDSPVLSILN